MSGLTKVETALKYLGGILSSPIAPIFCFSVPQNHKCVIRRFGKVDRVVEPGLRWAPPNGEFNHIFEGAKTHAFKDMRLLDSTGTPIIVSAILQYHISDPAKFIIISEGKTDVLERKATIAIQQICSSLPYSSSTELMDLRRATKSAEQDIYKILKPAVESSGFHSYGFTVDSLNIVEVNYAPEVAQQMLMKQQAQAYMEARKEIVASAVGVAKDTIASLPEMSKETQERIICNLLTTLTSHSTPQPVVQLR